MIQGPVGPWRIGTTAMRKFDSVWNDDRVSLHFHRSFLGSISWLIRNDFSQGLRVRKFFSARLATP